MTYRALLRSQVGWIRANLAVLVLVLVVLPALVATGSLLFADVLPRDAPVAVVAGEDATAADVDLVTAAVDVFAQPVRYETPAAAVRALDRERVYGVVTVPGGVTGEGSATIEMTVDGRVVPYVEPSAAIAAAIGGTLDRNLDADVTVDHRVRGNRIDLSTYLVPTFLFVLLGVLGFAYHPYVLASEADALDRIRVESSLEAYLAAKLTVLTGLSVAPIAMFGAVAALLGYPIALLDPTVVAVALVTVLTFAATASAVTFATGFGTAGRLANVLVLFGVVGFSGVAYPAGFFSPVRREIVRLVPTHYAMVLLRNASLKDLGASAYPAAAAVVVATLVASLVVAEFALVAYRRGA